MKLMIESLAYFIYQILSLTWPFIGIILLARIAWFMWMHYIQSDFISGIEFVLLEIVPPREVLRSPKAMELFFTNALYHLSKKGGLEAYWSGGVQLWFSLEIASIDGQVHFYIRVPSRLKELVETQMYAQYPQAQIKEVEDYSLSVDKVVHNGDWDFWGCEFDLEKPEAYPIKTYVDLGLDKDPKEEYKVDPISPVIELFGSIHKGEQMWMQIVITPAIKEYHTNGTRYEHHDWVKEAENEMKSLSKEFTKVSEEGISEIKVPKWTEPVLDGMTRKTAKIGFEVGIRVCYAAKKGFSNPNNKKSMRLVFRQYANPQSNSFKRINSTGRGAYGGIFLISPEKATRIAARMLLEYQERAFFHPPLRHYLLGGLPWPVSPSVFPNFFHAHTFVLNVEELATIWHFPGQVLQVPTLERIESKQSAPPTNLPT